jgi:O6-methylguanine-DNA--protein-cysteine methyltransferase
VPLDDPEIERELAAGESPDDAFDQQWARDVVAGALETVRRRLQAEDKAAHLRVYEAYELHPPGKAPSYEEVAAALGLSVAQVTNYLHTVRLRLKQAVAELVRDTVTNDAELAEELLEILSRKR